MNNRYLLFVYSKLKNNPAKFDALISSIEPFLLEGTYLKYIHSDTSVIFSFISRVDSFEELVENINVFIGMFTDQYYLLENTGRLGTNLDEESLTYLMKPEHNDGPIIEKENDIPVDRGISMPPIGFVTSTIYISPADYEIVPDEEPEVLELNTILEKIQKVGYDNLSKNEKEYLKNYK